MWDIVGHQKVVSLLRSGLEKDVLSHAYLFAGPHHVGKMTLALRLAQALNCEAAERPCGRCAPCQKIFAIKHADVQVIGLAGNGSSGTEKTEISIEQVKDMQHIASLPPFEGKHKVFIIDGAEQLSPDASNCLLKTLEEPVGRVTFILLTSAEKLLLPTVVSRCQRLELAPLSRGDVETELCSRGIDAGKAALLSRICRGRFGWAITATEDGNLLGQRQQELELLLDIIGAGYEERFAYAAHLAAQFTKSREPVMDVLTLWLGWWRDLLLVKTGCGTSITNVDREDSLKQLSRSYHLGQIKSFIDAVHLAMVQLKQNANARLVLEVLMLEIPEMNNG